MSSFDSPISSVDDDFFDRSKTADQILRIIQNTNKEWSTRIGLYGSWGEGKSSVLELFKGRAPSDDFIMVNFQPSGIQGRDELWREFRHEVGKALTESGLEEDDWNQALGSVSTVLNKTKDIAQNIGESLGMESSTAKAGLGVTSLLLNKILTPSKGEFKKVQDVVGDKRFVVVIDDLDRVNPELIPEILLSLRDVLDLPGFTFVLAFDYQVVTNSISTRNPAWGDGRKFLEKIIDFPMTISVPTRVQCNDFVRYWVSELDVPMPDSDNLGWLLEFLPKNPRKLKLYIRQLAVSKKSLARIGDRDTDLRLVCLWLVVKIDYPEFARKFCDNKDVFEMMRWLGLSFLRGDESDPAKGTRSEIDSFIENCGQDSGLNEVAINEAKLLIENISNSTSTSSAEGFAEALFFLDHPPAITHLELDQFFDCLDHKGFMTKLKTHAKRFDFEFSDVKEASLLLLCQKYDFLLRMASNERSDSRYQEYASQCKSLIALVSKLVNQSIIIPSAESFSEFYDVVRKWAHFIGNDSDQELRMLEAEFIIEFLSYVQKDLVRSDHRLLHSLPYASERHESTEALRESVVDKLDAGISDYLFSLLQTDGGINRLFGPQMLRHKALLFDVDGSFWVTRRQEILKIFDSETSVIVENAYHWLRLLGYGNSRNIGFSDESNILSTFASNTEIVEKLWKASSRFPLQFRVISEFEEIHKLLKRRNPDAELVQPDWMIVHIDQLERRLESEGSVSHDPLKN